MVDKNFAADLMAFVQHKGFVWGPEPEIYGGVAGFYTFAPLGKSLKNNIENQLRRVFMKYGIMEVECPIVVPLPVWEASGHAKNFNDPVIFCAQCGAKFRVDKLIEEYVEDIVADGLSEEKWLSLIKEHHIKCPACKKGTFKEKIEYHSLMMNTTVGFDIAASNRPETATTTYLPFLRYFDYFRKKTPFGVFQIGKAFRNEISPRQHLLRCREFTQAEAQIFIHPKDKNNYEKFDAIKNNILPFWDNKGQESHAKPVMMSINDALEKGFIKSQAYGWMLALVYELFTTVGIPQEHIRLRQHGPDEIAFYADDAWDLEVYTKSYGWYEMCGIHDRTDYDLKTHAKHSGTDLVAFHEGYKEKFVPHVLEIAFGTDRQVFAILDNFYEKKDKDDGKSVLKLPAHIAPIQVSVFPLVKKDPVRSVAKDLFETLNKKFLAVYDEAGAIGRRYLRASESGCPYCITIDFDGIEDNTVTIRDRDSEQQKRIPLTEVINKLEALLSYDMSFEEI